MIRALLSFVGGSLKKESLRVVIVSGDDQIYIVSNVHFETKNGRSIAKKGYRESVSRAAHRVMRYLKKDVSEDSYVTVKPKNIGPNRMHTIVWFASLDEFIPNSEQWRGHLFPLYEASLKRSQLQIVEKAIEDAKKVHDPFTQYQAA